MATPTTNTEGTTSIATTAAPELIYGWKWGGVLGTGATLSFSFISDQSRYDDPYGADDGVPEETDATYFLTNTEKVAIRNVLALISDVINVNFAEVTDTTTTNGDIRFGGTYNHANNAYAHAYYPGSYAEAGDVWFSEDWHTGGAAIAPGSYDFFTIVHEMGHALGLKHSFEGGSALPAALDSYFHTVMSYTASPKNPTGNNYASFFPTTLMYYDLVALQAMYGRATDHNAGATTYTFQDRKTYFQTIDDVSGIDVIKFVGSQFCKINLATGAFSTLSESISFWDSTSRATVCIGPNTVIENATGGTGNDTLLGNVVGNVLTGSGGDDKLSGLGGADILVGGAGRDQLTGGLANDFFVLNAANNYDTITDFAANADTIRLENSVFSALGAAAANLAASKFHVGANAHDATDRIIYNSSSGDLYYDADGSRAGAKVLIAKLDAGLTLTASDFQVI